MNKTTKPRTTEESEEAQRWLENRGVFVGDTVLFDWGLYTYLGVAALGNGPVAVLRHEDETHLHTVHHSRVTKLHQPKGGWVQEKEGGE